MIRLGTVAAGLSGLLACAAAAWVTRNLGYAHRHAARVARAGFTERDVVVDGSPLHYAEGPDNGPPLLLIHGQLTDWRSWSRALPELSRRFHVFAVDCHGHGASAPDAAKYTAVAMAADMHRFLDRVVGRPALVAGHSSGGLIAARLAVDAPALVGGLVLEDPPFFSSVTPRARKTFNYVAVATTAHEFLTTGEADFTSYFIRRSATWALFGPLARPLQLMGLAYRRRHPGAPVRFFALPPSLNELFRAMDSYDPRFGEAFYDNSFHDGFDHAATLSRITAPTALVHTRWSYDADGTLLAAMDADDAARACALLHDCAFYSVDTGHAFHFEDPDAFCAIVDDLAERVTRAPHRDP